MPAAPHVPSRPRLEHIDALRGLSALAVVFVHAFEIYNLGLPDIGDGLGGLTNRPEHLVIRALYEWFFRLGGLAVPVFIMLSGYSLMIPVARSGASMRTPRQIGTFFARRARRIIPPYYAAMALALLVIVVVPGMGTPAEVYWDRALRNLNWMNMLAHLLLVHNIVPGWGSSINPPFWSLPIEWQIYFLFPILVLLWRRFGVAVVFALTAMYMAVPLVLDIPLPPFSNINFVLLFVAGMAGAMINFAPDGLEARLRGRLPWWALTIAGMLLLLAIHVGKVAFGLPIPLMSTVAGLVFALLVVACTNDQLAGRETIVGRVLSHPALTWLGLFSYSLYLIHMPILATVARAARALGLTTTTSYLAVMFVGIPAALALAYGFHLVFERPFLNAPAPRERAVPEAQPLQLSVPGGDGATGQG